MKCCICKKEINKLELNNPWPLCLKEDSESKCCYDCNLNYVIPARICGLKDLDLSEIDDFIKTMDKIREEETK